MKRYHRKTVAECNHEDMTDLTRGRGTERNWWCSECGWHKWRGVEYTPDEWEVWVNDV